VKLSRRHVDSGTITYFCKVEINLHSFRAFEVISSKCALNLHSDYRAASVCIFCDKSKGCFLDQSEHVADCLNETSKFITFMSLKCLLWALTT